MLKEDRRLKLTQYVKSIALRNLIKEKSHLFIFRMNAFEIQNRILRDAVFFSQLKKGHNFCAGLLLKQFRPIFKISSF